MAEVPTGGGGARDARLDGYRAEVLRDVPGLSYAPLDALEDLAQQFDLREYTDEFICHEGEPAEVLFVLAEGEAEVIKAAADTKRYKVATLTPGVLFGHVGVMTLARRTASVRAVGRARVLQMPARRAREIVRSDDFRIASPFRRALIVALARQLYSATATTMKLAMDAGLTVPATEGEPRASQVTPAELDTVEEQLLIARGQQL